MKKTVIMLFFLFAMCGSAWSNTGKENERGDQGVLGVVTTLMELNLTENQKHELAVVLKNYRDQFRLAIAELRSTRMQLQKTMSLESPNKQAVTESYRRTAAAGEQVVLLLAQIKPELRSVLTIEQQRIWDKGAEEFATGLNERIDGRRGLLNLWVDRHSS